MNADTMWQQIRVGGWLTRQRVHGYSAILLAVAVLASVIWIALANGLVDRNDKPIGTDFSNVWAAGKLVLDGRPEAPYDPVLQHAAEREAFGGRPVPFFGWHYPPLFLIVAAALALLPYGWALLVWTAFGMAAYLATLRAILPRPETMLVALAFPATFVNLGHGQNGFLTASLLGGALLLLDRRPLVAGLLIGLLAYKPQFGVMIPLVLVATARWQVIAAAAATVLVACAGTFALSVARSGPHSPTRPSSPAWWCWKPATPAGRRSRASSRRCGCGAAASSSPTRRKPRSRLDWP